VLCRRPCRDNGTRGYRPYPDTLPTCAQLAGTRGEQVTWPFAPSMMRATKSSVGAERCAGAAPATGSSQTAHQPDPGRREPAHLNNREPDTALPHGGAFEQLASARRPGNGPGRPASSVPIMQREQHRKALVSHAKKKRKSREFCSPFKSVAEKDPSATPGGKELIRLWKIAERSGREECVQVPKPFVKWHTPMTSADEVPHQGGRSGRRSRGRNSNPFQRAEL
jgi:hypothetical protein